MLSKCQYRKTGPYNYVLEFSYSSWDKNLPFARWDRSVSFPWEWGQKMCLTNPHAVVKGVTFFWTTDRPISSSRSMISPDKSLDVLYVTFLVFALMVSVFAETFSESPSFWCYFLWLKGPFRSIQVLSGPFRSFQVLSGPFRSFQVLSGPFRSFQVLSGPFRSSQSLRNFKGLFNLFKSFWRLF
jgi:hypothetical protein